MTVEVKTRNIDPDVGRHRSDLANFVKKGDLAAAEQARRRLNEAVRIAAIRRAVAAAPPLSSEQLADITAMLRAAGAR